MVTLPVVDSIKDEGGRIPYQKAQSKTGSSLQCKQLEIPSGGSHVKNDLLQNHPRDTYFGSSISYCHTGISSRHSATGWGGDSLLRAIQAVGLSTPAPAVLSLTRVNV